MSETPQTDEKRYSIAEAHAFFARSLNGEVWKLMDKSDRSPEENTRMLAAAFASHYHWLHAGNSVNAQRGEWLISRAYAVLEQPENALAHANACAALTASHPEGLQDFDFIYAKEAVARALALSGKKDEARAILLEARALAEKIADPEDKKIVDDDLAAGKWYSVEA